jgi:hypothetical protein
MIYVISKATFGDYGVRDIQCNVNWDCCPYSEYALIPDSLVDGILATKGYCDITLNSEGTEVASFTARTIPNVPDECCGENTVLSVNGVKANNEGSLTLKPSDIGAVPTGRTVNGKALSSNISLSASDVGARPNTWMPAASDVGAAPAGYGLGVAGSNSVSSIQNIDKNGWWLANGDTPDGGYWFCLPRMVNSGDDIVIDAQSFNGLYNAKINKSTSKGWGEWEWVNPPLSLNNEYRTTERMDEKPVYCKRVLFGNGPNNTYKSVNHNIANLAQVVEWHAYNYNSGTNIEQGAGVTTITVNRETMNISSNENIAAWYIYFIIKYTKTTD